MLRGLRISLTRIDVHAQWVSQAVLDELDELPSEVEGGQIVRDEEGKATGVFVRPSRLFLNDLQTDA